MARHIWRMRMPSRISCVDAERSVFLDVCDWWVGGLELVRDCGAEV